MNTARKTLLSAAAGVASSRIAHLISDLELNDFLRPLRLARRRSPWLQNVAVLGAGILVGGVSALLLAPSSGVETRARLARKAGELGDAASRQVRELGEQVREEVAALHPHGDNNQPSVET